VWVVKRLIRVSIIFASVGFILNLGKYATWCNIVGRISKGVKCSVKGCNMDAVRSIDIGKVKQAGLDAEGDKRAYLCREHYKEYKKGSKKTAQIEKWRYGV